MYLFSELPEIVVFLALLVLQNEVVNAEFLLAVTGVIVTVSIIVHGTSATPLSALYGRAVERSTLQEERESTASRLFGGAAQVTPRISVKELAERLQYPNPPIVLDVRTRSQYERDGTRIPGSIRVPPDMVEEWAAPYLAEHPDGEPRLRPIATYCNLTGRSDQRPCGAATEQAGLRSLGPRGWLRRLEREISRGTSEDGAGGPLTFPGPPVLPPVPGSRTWSVADYVGKLCC